MSEPQAKSPASIDIYRVLTMLPHRYPFLMVDRVVSYEPMGYIDAYKNVTINEPFFQGHFPEYPVMPGVLILESLAQAGGLLVFKSVNDPMDGKIFLFSGLDRVKFRKPVLPGDRLDLHLDEVRRRFNIWKMNGVAKVNGEVVAEAHLTAAIVDKEGV